MEETYKNCGYGTSVKETILREQATDGRITLK
jgi:hypothetical protein